MIYVKIFETPDTVQSSGGLKTVLFFVWLQTYCSAALASHICQQHHLIIIQQ